ncbi:uncharacterized protein [Amphiura filiformis]|uniref:uncharacterized protein n=1 Tax=Amphiura filiformis TaxID=82378 RepID=UPI003B21AA5A
MATDGRTRTTACLYLIWTVIISGRYQCVLSQTRLEFSDAGHPTKEDGVLALFCKIWDLSNSHTVTISRFNFTETLTTNADVLMSDNSQTFLAKRDLSDDSRVFLLSMLGVSRSDAGDYTCEVSRREGQGLRIYASQTISVSIQYLPPAGQYPECSPNEQPLSVAWGKEIILNCSSELSNPPVTLTWMVAGTGEEVSTDRVYESQSGGFIYSHLMLTPDREDSETVFICESTSTAFPMEDAQECYIGPLKVISIPETTTPMVITTPPQQTLKPSDVSTPTTWPGDPDPTDGEECVNDAPCPLFDPDAMPWIAASVAGGIVAIMFFLIAIILLIQVRRLKGLAKARRKAVMEVAEGEGPYDLPYDTIQRARYADDENAYIAAIVRARVRANAEAKGLVMVQGESHYDDLPARPSAPQSTLSTTSGVVTVSRPIVPPEPPSTPRKENLI